MPLYEYRCSDCRSTKSLQRPIANRNDAVTCASCQREMELKPVAPGFVVVGGTPKQY